MRKILFVCFFLLFSIFEGFSQNKLGVPHVQFYDQRSYRQEPMNWAVQQASNGLMYIGNAAGLLEYDGSRWRHIPVSGDVVRSLCKHKDMMYVGTSNDFGRLVTNENGQLIYESLSAKLLKKGELMQTVWTIVSKNDHLYFNTQNEIFIYNPDSQETKRIRDSEGIYDFCKVDDQTLLVKNGKGDLLRLTDEHIFEPIAWLDELKKYDVTCSIAVGRYWISTDYETGEIFKIDPSLRTISRLKTNNAQWLAHSKVYTACQVNDSTFALGTKDNGVGIFTLSGRMLYKLGREEGLLSTNINELTLGKDGALWAATDEGIARISLDLPYTIFSKHSGIKTRAMSLGMSHLENQTSIYAGTNTGLKFLKNDGFFEAFNKNTTQTWQMLPFQKQSCIVAGGNAGFFYLKGERIVQRIGSNWATMAIERSKLDSNLVYIGLYNGFRIANYNPLADSFKILADLDSLKHPNRSIAEEPDGTVWIGSTFVGFFRLQIDRSLPIEKAAKIAKFKHFVSGINEIKGCRVERIGKQTYFFTESQVYVFDAKKEVFVPTPLWNFDWSKTPYKRSIHGFWTESIGKVWLKNAKQIIDFDPQDGALRSIDSTTLRSVPGKILSIIKEASGVYWIGSEEDIKRFENLRAPQTALVAHIRKIFSSNTDSLLWGGAGHIPSLRNLAYKHNSLLIEFAALYYVFEPETQFQFFLDGYDKHWSEWSNDAKKEYTNLYEGPYTFKVRARNALGQESAICSFAFQIQPPFYRHFLAYLLYIVLAFLSVWLLIRYNTKRLKQKQIELEAIVKIRTQEIQLKNVELEQQKEEIIVQAENLKEVNADITEKSNTIQSALEKLEEQNKHITASINYAKRIQSAILPTSEELSNTFKDYFVLFKPRDIVSGDFYWLARRVSRDHEHISVVAVADCTGHGVPGAFMSLIGNEILSEIVYNRLVFMPNEILTMLNSRIQQALKQKENKNRDGMDISICTIDWQAKRAFYAGAQNPLIYVQDQQLTRIKADKLAIGGYQNDEDITFVLHEIPLKSQENNYLPTQIYLFSDGIQDQFGGQESKKFMLRNLEKHIQETARYDMLTQKENLNQIIDKWLENHRQIDDMLICGFVLDFGLA